MKAELIFPSHLASLKAGSCFLGCIAMVWDMGVPGFQKGAHSLVDWHTIHAHTKHPRKAIPGTILLSDNEVIVVTTFNQVIYTMYSTLLRHNFWKHLNKKRSYHSLHFRHPLKAQILKHIWTQRGHTIHFISAIHSRHKFWKTFEH